MFNIEKKITHISQENLGTIAFPCLLTTYENFVAFYLSLCFFGIIFRFQLRFCGNLNMANYSRKLFKNFLKAIYGDLSKSLTILRHSRYHYRYQKYQGYYRKIIVIKKITYCWWPPFQRGQASQYGQGKIHF